MTLDIAPKTFRRYVDDTHARFGSRNNAIEFLNVLNSQDSQIPYTIEYENDHKELNFLDAIIRNNLNHSYNFAVYRKPVITNVQIKPHSNVCLNIAVGVFKGSLSRALHICLENYLGRHSKSTFVVQEGGSLKSEVKQTGRGGVGPSLSVHSLCEKNYLLLKQQTEFFLISCSAVAKCFCFEPSPAYKGVFY